MKTVLGAALTANGNYGQSRPEHPPRKEALDDFASHVTGAIPGVWCAASPQEALNYLEERAHRAALIAGGETLHNAFLSQDLVDELVFDILPELQSSGLKSLSE